MQAGSTPTHRDIAHQTLGTQLTISMNRLSPTLRCSPQGPQHTVETHTYTHHSPLNVTSIRTYKHIHHTRIHTCIHAHTPQTRIHTPNTRTCMRTYTHTHKYTHSLPLHTHIHTHTAHLFNISCQIPVVLRSVARHVFTEESRHWLGGHGLNSAP